MIEILVVAVLILLNGVFALSELAVVSSRRPRLMALTRSGQRGAATALALLDNPGRFLSTVQIGITLVGILAGAFSGAALGSQLAQTLRGYGLDAAWADAIGYGLVVAVITFLSVIIGELIPKQLALRDPESIACRIAPPMAALSRAATPVVWLLDSSSRALFALFGQSSSGRGAVTDEEIRTLVAEAESTGTIEASERSMISGVLRLGDRSVRGAMTPRKDVEVLDLGEDEQTLRSRLASATHSLLPVTDGEPDNVVGVVDIRSLFAAALGERALSLGEHLQKAQAIPDTIDALEAIEKLRGAEVPIALVHDEYGHFEGVITPADALKVILGAAPSSSDGSEAAVRRADGSWLLSGAMPVDEMADVVGLTLPPVRRDYETLAGFVIDGLKRLPATGDTIDALGWRFEIVDMDGRRIDKVLAWSLRGAPALEPTVDPA
ncbi:MAG: hemolysin family protein [Bauldia sp.]